MPDPTSAAAVGWLILTAAGLAVGLLNVLKLVDRFKGKPTGGEVRSEGLAMFSTKVDLVNHMAEDAREHANIWSKIGGMERGLTKEMQEMERRMNAIAEERTVKLHDRLNELLSEVHEMRGEMRGSAERKRP